jgi:hypothetical protein
MEDSAHAGNRKIGFNVLLGIPAEGAYPIAFLDPEPLESGCQSFSALGNLFKAGPAGVVSHECDDFAIRACRSAVVEDGVDRQGPILHRAEHTSLLLVV